MQSQITTDDARRFRDGRTVAGIVVVTILGLIALWAISRNADSALQQDKVALPVSAVTGTAGCSNFANFWTTGSRIGVPVESITGLTNCRVAVDGTWFVPADDTDSRLSGTDQLTLAERDSVQPLKNQIETDLFALDQAMPGSLQQSFKSNYVSANQPVFGHTRRSAPAIGDKRARYIRIARAFLISPDRTALADYVAWATARRESASDQFQAACHASTDFQYLWRACDGVPAEFQVGYMPLLWDLNDPVLLQDYLIFKARSGDPLPLPATPVSAY